MRRSGLALVLALAALDAGAADPRGGEILATAFARRYGVDFTADVDLSVRDRGGAELERRFRAASKVIDGRVHSLGRLRDPDYVRGMAILTIEAEDRGHDAFVYLPSLDKVRRVAPSQRNDSFLGSDVTYHDLERQRAGDFEVVAVASASVAGEPVFRVEALPRGRSRHARVVFAIAREDHAILETRYFRKGSESPYRVLSVPREGMLHLGDHVFPTRLEVRNADRGTLTRVHFRNVVSDPALPDGIFSASALDRQRRIPDAPR